MSETTPQDSAAMSPASTGSVAGEPVAWAVWDDPLEPTVCMMEGDAIEFARVNGGAEISPLYLSPTLGSMKWIPVTERMPGEGVRVLFFENGELFVGVFWCEGWRAAHPWPRTFAPTHWMPFPAPPTDAK